MYAVKTPVAQRQHRWTQVGVAGLGALLAWSLGTLLPALPGTGLAAPVVGLLLVGTVVVVTLLRRLQRSRAETADAKRYFEAVSDAALDAMYLLRAVRDAHGNVTDFRLDHCNERGARLVGLTKEKLIGRSLVKIMSQQNDAHFFNQFCQVIASREPVQEEFFFAAKGSGGLWLHHQAVPVGDGVAVTTRDVTASHRREEQMRAAHQALNDSEKRLRAITDNIPALISYVDRDGRFQFCNAKHHSWLGKDPTAMLGRTFEEVYGEATSAWLRPQLNKAWAGEHVQIERQGRIGDAPVYYRGDYIPDVAEDGSVRGCYAITIDITARREAELQLQQSERQLVELINNVPATIGCFDLQERCVYANDMSLRVLGLTRAAVPGITLRDALGQANYAQHEPHLPAVLGGRNVRFEGRTAYGGRDMHYQANLVPQRASNGEPRGFYVINFDITELKAAQQQQARVEQRLRAITDNLPVLISYIDRNERYGFANATFQDWMGVDPAALIGQPMRATIDPELYGECEPQIRRAMNGKRIGFDLQLKVLGVNRHLHTQYIPDVQPDGSVAGFYAMSTDITALKAVERELGFLARFDALTGLANRFQFNEKLPEALARCQRTGRALALMFLDIDHFKRINDSLGHAVGDSALKEFARRLRHSVRATDTVARLAGDEFVVLLEGLQGAEEPQRIARKILAEINRPFDLDGNTVAVTTSVGIAYTETGRMAASALLARADQALYEAKAAGRNQFEFAPA